MIPFNPFGSGCFRNGPECHFSPMGDKREIYKRILEKVFLLLRKRRKKEMVPFLPRAGFIWVWLLELLQPSCWWVAWGWCFLWRRAEPSVLQRSRTGALFTLSWATLPESPYCLSNFAMIFSFICCRNHTNSFDFSFSDYTVPFSVSRISVWFCSVQFRNFSWYTLPL